MRISLKRTHTPRKPRPPTILNETHDFEALVKEYELVTNRLDKTDDRIIQLVGVGLAALGAVLLFLSRTVPAETPAGGALGTNPEPVANPIGPLWDNAIYCLALFSGFYAVLYLAFRYIYVRKGQAKPWPPSFTNLSSFRLRDRKAAIKKLQEEARGKGPEELEAFERDFRKLSAYDTADEDSLKKMGLAYFSLPLFGVLVIPVVEALVAPNLRIEPNIPPVELLWLLMLLFTGLNSLIIYVMYSSFGYLWLCRVLSQRLNTILRRQVLLRFDRALMPSLFFSYSMGNWKPRLSYWLLLGLVAVLYCSVLFIFFAQTYVKSWCLGSVFLVFFLFATFLQVFSLSGVRHDLDNRHVIFMEEQQEYMKNK